MIRAAALAAAFALTVPTTPALSAPIEVQSTPIRSFARLNPTQRQFDRLTFLGGLVLRSDAEHFGGFSGLRLSADGAGLTAITDRGYWLSAILIDEGGGRPVRLENADLRPMPAPGGRQMPKTRDYDTEALEIAGRRAFVTSEGAHRLFRMDLDASGYPVSARALPLPPGVAKLRRNAGLEAIALLPPGHPNAGALLVIAEEGRNADADHPAWITGAPRSLAPRGWAPLRIKNRDGYAVTDLVGLPDGSGFAMLERRYRPPFSLSIRMRLIAAGDIRPNALVDGEMLLEATLAQEIDNMEGIAAHRAADGRTVLTLISDDNFNRLQRTILLRFAIEDQASAD